MNFKYFPGSILNRQPNGFRGSSGIMNMQVTPRLSGRRTFLALWAAVLGIWTGAVVPVEAQPPTPAPVVTKPAPEAPKTPLKTVSFEMRDKPWSSVLEWLSDQSGLPVVSSDKPQGTFTFVSPKGKTYTIPEVIDILNQ